MEKNHKVLLAVPALLLFLSSCSTPPPVRDPTSPYWKEVTDPGRLENDQEKAEGLARQIREVHSHLAPVLSEYLKNDMLTTLRGLQQSLDSGDAGKAEVMLETLKNQLKWLVDYLSGTQEVNRLRKVFGGGSDSPINQDIDRVLKDARQALGGTSWPEVRRTCEALVHFRDRNLEPAKFYVQQDAHLRYIGDISATLAAQMQAAMEPLRRALREGSWEEQWRVFESRQPPAGYAAAVAAGINSGNQQVQFLPPAKSRELVEAIQAMRDALQGDSWEQVKTLADNIAFILGDHAFARIPTPCVRILSIDGGGIRGIIPATFLQMLEDATGKRVAEMFDVIGGTSTGGILALGLALPDKDNPGQPLLRPEKLVELYEKKGKKIFPSSPFKYVRVLFGPRYRAKPLEEVLNGFFHTTMIDQAVTNVVVPAFRLDVPDHWIFSTYSNDPSPFFMWEVARATSAAPTYFPPFRFPIPKEAGLQDRKSMGAIDGGVFANNPAPYVLRETTDWEYRVNKKPHDVSHPLLLLSLGTGRVNDPLTFEKAWSSGALGWIPQMINILTSDPGMENYARTMLDHSDQYLRLQPEISDSNSRLDDASKKNIAELKEIPGQFLASHPEDREKFNNFIELLSRERPPECPRIVRSFLEARRP